MADNDKSNDTNKAAPAARPAADAPRAAADTSRAARDVRREDVESERSARADRPQDVGGKPTPTQQENDEIRNGLRHIDDKEADGSAPDPLVEIGRAHV